jgi:hypothetical protein
VGHKYRYEFRDLLTNEKLDVLPLYGVNMNWTLATKGNNTYGDFTGTYKSDIYRRATADILGATQPGRTALWCYRDGNPIWSGILWSRTYSSQAGGTYQLYAQAMDSYAERFIFTANTAWTADARNILQFVWGEMVLRGPEWNIKLGMPGNFIINLTPITKTITGNEQVVGGSVIKEMIDLGAEYRLGYSLDANARPTTRLEIGRWDGAGGALPVGTPPGYSAAELTYPGSISNYWVTDSAAKGGTNLYAIGKGTGVSTPRGSVANSLLIAGGYPGLGLKLNFRDAETQALLDDHLNKAIPYYNVPIVSPSLKLSSTAKDVFGTFFPGDFIYTVINDPFRYDAVSKTHYRVVSMSLSPNGGDEEMDFTIAQPSTMLGEG